MRILFFTLDNNNIIKKKQIDNIYLFKVYKHEIFN